jgi:hypothetical protein
MNLYQYQAAMVERANIIKRRSAEESRIVYLEALALAGACLAFLEQHRGVRQINVCGEWNSDGGFSLGPSVEFVDGYGDADKQRDLEDELYEALAGVDVGLFDHRLGDEEVLVSQDDIVHSDPEALAKFMGLIK